MVFSFVGLHLDLMLTVCGEGCDGRLFEAGTLSYGVAGCRVEVLVLQSTIQSLGLVGDLNKVDALVDGVFRCRKQVKV